MIRKYTILLILFLSACRSNAQTVSTRVVKDGLFIPWEILYAPDGRIWFTQKNGYICRVTPATGATDTIYHETATVIKGEGGMTGMALHPSFPAQPYVYVAHNYQQGANYRIRIMRYTYNGSNALGSPVVLLDNINGSNNHNGCRVMATGDKLYITTGDAENLNSPQNVSSLNGKVLRINLDGTIPADNPIANSPVWSWGHRNPQGLVTANGLIYSSEHGPSTDDEINIIRKGRNFGWPNVAGYCDQPGELTFCSDSNVVTPVKAWTPTLAVSGMDYYQSQAMFPQFAQSLILATLKDEHLYHLGLNATRDSVVSTTVINGVNYGRLRDICIAPSGRIYVSTSNSNAAGPPPHTDKIIELYDPNASGIPPINATGMRLYPNPAQQLLQIELISPVQGTYTITDVQGRSVKSGELRGSKVSVPVQDLGAAVYLVRIDDGKGGRMVQRFIKSE